MNEQACAFACGIYGSISAIICWYTVFAKEWELLWFVSLFSGVVVLLSGFSLICKYL